MWGVFDMGFGAAIPLITSAVGAAGSIIGGANSANASSQAANAQSEAAAQNIQSWQSALPSLINQTQTGYGQAYGLLNGQGQAYGNANQAAQADLNNGVNAYNNAVTSGTQNLNNGINNWFNMDQDNQSLNGSATGLNAQAASSYANLLANPSSVTSTPGYQFNLGQGLQALDQGAAAKGGLFSGAQGQAEQQFGQNYATNTYNQQLGNYANAMGASNPALANVTNSNLQTAQGVGTADNQISQLGMQGATGVAGLDTSMANANMTTGQGYANMYGSQATNAQNDTTSLNNLWLSYLNGSSGQNTNSGNAQSQGIMGSANATNQGLTGLGNSLNSGAQNYYTNSIIGPYYQSLTARNNAAAS